MSGTYRQLCASACQKRPINFVPNFSHLEVLVGVAQRSVRSHERAAGFGQQKGARKWPLVGQVAHLLVLATGQKA